MLTHKTKYRVIYGDTDRMGIAYHANYLRWFEIGRTELFRAWGLPYREIEAKGIMLPVSEVRCKYLAPAKYDDLLIIEAGFDPQLRAALKVDYRILSEDEKTVHATGYSRHACVDSNGKVIRPPAFITELIRHNTNENPE